MQQEADATPGGSNSPDSDEITDPTTGLPEDVMGRLMLVLGDDATTWLQNKEVFSPEEVALKMRVSVHTVRRLLRDGHLGGFKIGGRWVVPGSSIVEYLSTRWSG